MRYDNEGNDVSLGKPKPLFKADDFCLRGGSQLFCLFAAAKQNKERKGKYVTKFGFDLSKRHFTGGNL